MNSAAGDERPVNPSSAIPLHLQLRSHLRAQIVNHSLPPGTPLPSEAQLQDQFGVSRSVVRQALGALAAEGLIDRGRGRGSTVAPRREHHRLIQRIPGLSTQIAETGVSVETEILAFSVEAARGSAAVLGTTDVLALKRLRSVDGSPIALIHTWLPLPLCAGLTAEELRNASLHTVLREKFGVDIATGRRQIRAAPADADLLALLRMEAHSPVLLLEGTSVDATGRTVEAFTTWHHADQVVFDIDVVNDRNSAQSVSTPSERHTGQNRTEPSEATARPDIIPAKVGTPNGTALTLADRSQELGLSLERFAEDLRLLGKDRS